MKLIASRTDGLYPGKLMTGVALGIVLIATLAAPAHAADRGRGRGGDRGWHAHAGHDHRYYGQPGYVYAPPVVYAPPPVYQSPGLNLIVPLNIR
ncbi:MAG: hypothetical protein WCD70_08930 [Alphaproteobacteria bacterium]